MLIGIVGKPNVGKSTFFKAATLSEILIANYPFATIKPNHGIGYVKVDCIDKEFNTKCMPKHGFCINHNRFVPIELMDVAGLVPGASEGKGLGNQFLDNLRQADAFIHIIDASGKTDIEGKNTENHDPCKDVEFLESELVEWYLGLLKKIWRQFTRKAETEDVSFSQAVAKQFSGLKINEDQVKDVLRKIDFKQKASAWTDEQIREFAKKLLFYTKPMIIAANKCDDENAEKNIKKLKQNFPDLIIIPCSAESELALREASKDELINYIPGEDNFEITKQGEQKLTKKQTSALNFIKKNILHKYKTTGIQDILNKIVFDLLKMIVIFPVENSTKFSDSQGNILPDCHLLPEGSTALDLAFKIHADIGKNFIKAIDARKKTALGKDHKLKHQDVVEIVAK